MTGDTGLKRRMALALVAAALVCGLVVVSAARLLAGAGVWPGAAAIAHALGGVEGGRTCSNSLEAFEQSYAKGFRAFEADIMLTEEGEAVLAHSAREWEAYSTWPELAGYTTLQFTDLCALMQKYPDIWVITDTKNTDADGIRREFEAMTAAARSVGAEKVLERVVVQLYHEEMYEVVEEVYPFSNYIFTLYQRWDGDMEEFAGICDWCEEHGVKTVTMWYYLMTGDVVDMAGAHGLDVYVHTVNDLSQAQALLDMGGKGIYTDSLAPGLLKTAK